MGVHTFTGGQVPDGMEKPEGNIGYPPFELTVQSLNKQHGIFGVLITYVRGIQYRLLILFQLLKGQTDLGP